MFSTIILKELENKIKKLEKKDVDLIITDFDNTIFCRNEQIEISELLRNNRGKKWNDILREIIWIENAMEMFYIGKNYPTIITSKLRVNHDLILTAWYIDIQTAKIKACKLNHINYIIVNNPEEKIIETIKYIANILKFIPNKITVYEDKPKYFIEYKYFLQDFLWVKIEIMYVEMNDNNSDPKITKIEA